MQVGTVWGLRIPSVAASTAASGATEVKSCDVEHKHKYEELHDQYLKLFEEELSGDKPHVVVEPGLRRVGSSTIDRFLKECREIHDGQYTALFEEHTYAWTTNTSTY
ncbi:hypothetical protein PR003_g20420 [Phytophthora rubi]|uniref:Uncharacterized protein n=1 Tax=Phytophthora rubi TaxID=129364 RepID=A0A6A4DN01_9STRA|nr:hypothetical protein PR003_g20420 [Phytophthora rubi]